MKLKEIAHGPVSARVERTLSHPADKLFHILVDFKEHHERISPFTLVRSSYTVREGGVGEGTVVDLASRLTRGTTLTYHVHLLPEERAFEFRSECGTIVHGFHVIPDGPSRSRVILWVDSTYFQGWLHVVNRLMTRMQIQRLMHEKLDHLDRYAATFGNIVLHTHIDDAPVVPGVATSGSLT